MLLPLRTSPYYRQVVRLLKGQYYYDPFFSRITTDEIYLVSFPRSGNTWLRCMLTSLMLGSPVSVDLVQATIPDVYISRLQAQPKPKIRPLIVKTHARFADIPGKVIYLVRDGRQALMSFYFYTQLAGVARNREKSIADFFLDEDLYPAPWHVHVQEWLQGLRSWNPTRCKIIRYEDLVESPAEMLGAIADFAGINSTTATREQAVAWNTRDRLHSIEQEAGPGTLNYVSAAVRPTSLEAVLTGHQIEQYETLAGPLLQQLGYADVLKSDGDRQLLRIPDALPTSE